MTTPIGTLALSAALVLAPALALAQEETPYWAQEGWTADVPAEAAAPPAEAPPAPVYEGQVQPAPAPQGQWVYTQQYGWIWMPHADAYTQVPASGAGEPLAYVYSPVRGWCWLAAPWIWGIGPWPVFGVWGPARFAWYGHGWWRQPARWHYAPAYAYWGGYRGHGHAPVRRGPAGITRPAPHFRGSSFDRAAPAPSRGFVGRSGGGGAPRASAPHAGGGAPRGGWSGGHSGGGRGGHGGGRGGGIHAGDRGGGSGHR